MLVFDHPWLLLSIAFAALPLLALLRVRTVGIGFPFPGPPERRLQARLPAPQTLRQKFGWLPDILRALALVFAGLAAAGPHWGSVRMTDETRGIAIELLVDRSSSMTLTDMRDTGPAPLSRLEVVKKIAKEFLKGRSGDAIGLVSFAAHPQSLSPMVSHNETGLARSIDSIEVATGREDETAIGDAISLAASRIHQVEQTRAISFRSKIIVLMTDGQENGGTRRLGDAAQIAARWNIRVYAIGIRPTPEDTGREEEVGYGLDAVAAATNGMAVTASDGAGLRKFFATINRLEPNDIQVTGLNGGLNAAGAALLAAFALICCEIALRQTWMRVIP